MERACVLRGRESSQEALANSTVPENECTVAYGDIENKVIVLILA